VIDMKFMLNNIAPSTKDFSFRALNNLDEKDALVIHNPPDACCESPVLIRSTIPLSDHISYIQENNIKKAIIVADNISFVEQCKSLEYIWAIPPISSEILDYSPLYTLPHLHWFRCTLDSIHVCPIAFERLSKLSYLSVTGWTSDMNIGYLNCLKTLYLDSTKTNVQNLDFLRGANSLENLVISDSSILSLSGIEHASNLKRFELSYNRKLSDISQLAELKDTLVWLDIENCNNIVDYSVLASLRNLELLRLSGTKNLPSIEFIESMPNLKCLVISMNIVDGQLGYIKEIPYVSIKNRKHYTHKDKDFSKNTPFPLFISAYN